MKSALIRFLIFISFAGLPIALFFYDAHLAGSIAAEKELDNLREQARGQIENLRRSGSPEGQLMDAFHRFLIRTAKLGSWLGGDTVEGGIRKLYKKMLANTLPPHDLAVVRVGDDHVKVLFFVSQNLGSTPQLATTFATAAVRGKPKSAFNLLSKRLADILYCPFSEEVLQLLIPGWRGTVQAVFDVSRTRAIFWDSIKPTGESFQIVVLSFFEFRKALRDERFALDLFLQSGDSMEENSEFGVALIPSEAGSPLFSKFVESRPALLAHLQDAARGAVTLPEEELLGDLVLFKGDNLIGKDYFPVFAYNLRTRLPQPSRMEKGLQAALGLMTLLALGFAGKRVLETSGLPFGVGPGIFLTFVLVALLPIVIASAVFRGTMFQQERTERGKISEKLHNDLVQIDEGFSYAHSRFRSGIRRSVLKPDFHEKLKTMEAEKTGATLAGCGKEVLKAVGIETAFTTVPGERAKLKPDGSERDLRDIFHLIGMMGGNNLRKSWPPILAEDDEPSSTNSLMGKKDELLEFFSYLNRKILAKMEETFEKKGPRNKDSKMGFAKETLEGMKHDEMFNSFSTIGGTGLFLSVIYSPEKETEFKLSTGKTFILQTMIFIGKQLTNAILWVWSDVAIEEAYLRDLLKGAEETFGIMKKEIGRDCAIPRPIEKQSPLHDLLGKVERTGVGVRTQSEKGDLVMEALPAAQIPSFILAGSRDATQVTKASEWNQYLFRGGMISLLALAAIIAILGTAYFITPLQEILEKMSAIDNRRYDVNLDESRPDEFGVLAKAFNHMVKGLREGQLLRKFVSTSVRKAVRDDSTGTDSHQGIPKKITALFSALHKFNKFASVHTPAEVFTALESHLQAVNNASERHGGEIDKIMGEKILLVFYHDDFPNDREASLAALNCARDIAASMERSGPVPVSVGINSGTAISGILGVRSVRVDFTVIGDAVNLAARLCAVAHGIEGNRVVISGETLQNTQEAVKTEKLPVTQVKGKTQTVEAFQVLA